MSYRTVTLLLVTFLVFLNYFCDCFDVGASGSKTVFKFFNTTDFDTTCLPSQPCVRKCCPENYIYWLPHKTCISTGDSNFFPKFHNGIQLVYQNSTVITVFTQNLKCKTGQTRFRLSPETNRDDVFLLQETGRLFFPNLEFPDNYIDLENYCMETFAKPNQTFVSVMACFGNEKLDMVDVETKSPGMIISMPFLLATFLIYLALPERNLHQKALMFYVINLLLAYIFLVNIQLSQTHIRLIHCKIIGFGTLFCFMSSFFWMNVICIDIWYAFSGSKGFIGSRAASERRRFLYYLAYACGVPFLHTFIVILLNENVDASESHFPGVTATNCFLGQNLPQLLYFYWLVAALIATNILLFSFTACKIKKIKKETSILKRQDSKRHVYESDKQKFNLYLKLLFAMGVNWSMEFISFAVKWARGNDVPDELWYFTDFCNASYGVFIFFIFVFKKKMWKLVQKRYYSLIGKPHLAPSLTTTYTTQTSYSSSRKVSIAESALGPENNPMMGSKN